MPLAKNYIISILLFILLFSSFSGCIFEDLFSGGTEFSLQEFDIVDYNGFPALYIRFSCSGTVTVKLSDTNSKLLDSDYFFKGDHETHLFFAEYFHNVNSGNYKIKAYDNDYKNIYSKSIPVKGVNLSILSSGQKWWKRDNPIFKYSLIGLNMNVQNSGDVPCYPYEVETILDSTIYTGRILPSVILPGDTKNIFAFIFKERIPQDSTYSLDIKGYDKNLLATNIFPVEIKDETSVKEFKWSFNGPNSIKIPSHDYLYDYYIGLDRINIEDYSLYVFNPFDESYIDIINSGLLSRFGNGNDVQKINFAASFVQHFEYMEDTTELDYPRYPIETIFNNGGGGDCEDKAILTASILKNMGYNVSLFRLPDHMAVGVNLSEDAISNFDFYVDGYYFLETTTGRNPCGYIPDEYEDLTSEVIVYPIITRPVLDHIWKDEIITIYKNTERGDLVKVTVFVENYGSGPADNIVIEAGFFTLGDYKSLYEQSTISSLEPGMKKKITLSVNIPKGITTTFKTRIIIDDEVIDERESINTFGSV
jgi:hypothetical protein